MVETFQDEIERLRWKVEELTSIESHYGCLTGDCPHDNANDCVKTLRPVIITANQRIEELEKQLDEALKERDEATDAMSWLGSQTGGNGDYVFSTVDPDAPSTPQKMADLIAGRYEELEGALKWTYVEEKSPPEDEELLILTKRGNPWIAEYHQELDEFFDPRCPDELTPTICKTSEVLAWQRIVPPDKHAHLIGGEDGDT